MQPTFLPWAGYFNLMAQSNIFVFHDDIQLEKRSWQTRNRLLCGGKTTWVSVPIRHISESQSINETEMLLDTKWRENFRRMFVLNYASHPHFNDANVVVDQIVETPWAGVAALNESINSYIATKLSITSKLYRSIDLPIDGKRTESLVKFCEYFSATEYLSPVGAAEYLALDDFVGRAPCKLRFQDFTPQLYPQSGQSEFVSHLSILDVLANLGWSKTAGYVRDECNSRLQAAV
jgi:hypothetical protein